jgi:hypothetical protein
MTSPTIWARSAGSFSPWPSVGGQEPLEPGFLRLQLLEAFRPTHLQAAVLLELLLISLSRHADMLARLGYGLALRKEDLRIRDLAGDPLGAGTLPRHEFAPRVKPAAIITSQLDSSKEGRPAVNGDCRQ